MNRIAAILILFAPAALPASDDLLGRSGGGSSSGGGADWRHQRSLIEERYQNSAIHPQIRKMERGRGLPKYDRLVEDMEENRCHKEAIDQLRQYLYPYRY